MNDTLQPESMPVSEGWISLNPNNECKLYLSSKSELFGSAKEERSGKWVLLHEAS